MCPVAHEADRARRPQARRSEMFSAIGGTPQSPRWRDLANPHKGSPSTCGAGALHHHGTPAVYAWVVACHPPLPRLRANESDSTGSPEPIRVPGSRMQEAEHDTEERVHRHLVNEDTGARYEWRPRPASPIGVDPIEHGHRRPQNEILKLRGYEALSPAAPHPAERRSEECAVREMHDDAEPAPGPPGREQCAEKTDVRIRRSEDSLTDWLRRYPDGCRHRSRH